MSQVKSTLETIYDGWQEYQEKLIQALEPLTMQQLNLRPAAHLRSIGEIARHIIGARGRWFFDEMEEGGAEMDALGIWDRRGQPTRSAAELVAGLRATWRVMHTCLERWTEADLAFVFKGEDSEGPFESSRSWVVWHLIEHDLHHGGEIFITLGMHGLPTPNI